jgi:hypothetical protein
MRSIRRMPSVALGLGLASLVVVAAGVALAAPSVHAAAKINGSNIKKHSIAGNRLKPNTVTGKQIKESTLHGFVSSARFFDIPLTNMNKGDSNRFLGRFGPMRLVGKCSADGANTVAEVDLTTSTDIEIDSETFPLTMTTLTPSSPPYPLATEDSSDPGALNVDYPSLYEPGHRSFALAGSGGVDALANAAGSDCAFWGDLQNDGH